MLDRVVFLATKGVIIVVGLGLPIWLKREAEMNADTRRVEPFRRTAGRHVRINNERRLPYVRQCQTTSAASQASPTTTAEATRQDGATAAAHADIGGDRHLPQLAVDSTVAVAATEQRCAPVPIDQDDQPTMVIAWLQSVLSTTTGSLRAERDHHAATAAELEDRLARMAAIATTSDAAVVTLAARVSADREASAAANLALVAAKEQLSAAVQERDSARTTAGELELTLQQATSAANATAADRDAATVAAATACLLYTSPSPRD